MIFHDSRNLEYRNPFGAMHPNEKVHLQLLAEGAFGVSIRTWVDGRGEEMIPMAKPEVGEKNPSNAKSDIFTADITMPNYPCVFWYFFVIYFDGKTVCYGNNRKELGGVGEVYENETPQSFQITVYKPYDVPKWYPDSIAYQIFPDRFCKAESSDIQFSADGDSDCPLRKTEDWDTLPYYIKNEDGSIKEWNFWGGNLRGIESKLDYLHSLGVSCIYLNPIFKARSNHRYDTADYMMIDPMLGSEDDFISLCQKAKSMGIHIILDGVFSHTGIESKYVKEHPEWYTGEYWWGVKDLPEVNETNPSFTQFICGDNGVIAHWIKLGASGFRLDVADELPDEFIKNVRKAVKKANSDAVLLGEVWEDASNKISYDKRREFLYGEELDCVMNYPLRSLILAFLRGETSACDFSIKVMSLMENYPKEAFYSNFNLIDSHDRERALTSLGGNKQLLKLAALMSYSLPGVPVIYYGDEAGLLGSTDPDNRRTYPWGKEDLALINYYIKLGEFYNSQPLFKTGELKIEAKDLDTVAITRFDYINSITVEINRKAEKCNIFTHKM